jgi:hypothetical protein
MPGQHSAARPWLSLPSLIRGRFRLCILLLAGAEQAAVGAAILAAVYNGNPAASFLPQHARHILSVPSSAAGVVWAASGVIVLALSWWPPMERWMFALAVFVHAAWSLAWAVHAFNYGQAGDWEPALTFGFGAAALLVGSGWPDP